MPGFLDIDLVGTRAASRSGSGLNCHGDRFRDPGWTENRSVRNKVRFCCGLKWFVICDGSAQIPFSSTSSALVS